MDGVLDLERLLARVAHGFRRPARGASRLPQRWGACPPIAGGGFALCKAPSWVPQLAAATSTALRTCMTLIVGTLVDEPPVTFADGGVVRAGIHTELDELRENSAGAAGRRWSPSKNASVRAPESRSLKVRFNSVFGYYLEVTKANAKVGPGRLRAQADTGQRGALHHARTQRLRGQNPDRAGALASKLNAASSPKCAHTLLAGAGRDPRGRAAESRKSTFSPTSPTLPPCAAGPAQWSKTVRRARVHRKARHPVVERRMEESGVGRFIPNSLFLELAAKAPRSC